VIINSKRTNEVIAQRDGAAKFIIANEVLPSRSASAEKQFFVGRRIPIFTTVGITTLGMADTRCLRAPREARPNPAAPGRWPGAAPPAGWPGMEGHLSGEET